MSVITKQQRAVAINPSRACAPMGAMLANFGIHGALTINHGSQGCATYPRHQMARHFREPIEVGTTSLTERTTVYGGKENLIAALKNIYERFHPTMITICSTCLSETIGDDMMAIVDDFRSAYPEMDVPILAVKTPSYVGTHITGFDSYLKQLLTEFPERRARGETNGKVNIIPGWVNPGDIRELKSIAHEMGVDATFLTDYSDTLDGGFYTPRPHFPPGGTTLDEVRDCSRALGTLAIQRYVGGEAAKVLQRRHNVPAHILPMPIGLANTDAFVQTLTKISGKPVSPTLESERARLLDALVDTHMFTTGTRVAIYGDPDLVEGLTRLVAEMGIQPAYVLSPSDFEAWGKQMQAMTEELGVESEILLKADLHELHKRIKASPVDLIIGHSKGKFIADAEDIPLIRAGFPVEDRVGYQRRSVVGYKGAIALVDEITNALLARKGTSVISSTLLTLDVEGPTNIPLSGGGCGGGCGGQN